MPEPHLFLEFIDPAQSLLVNVTKVDRLLQGKCTFGMRLSDSEVAEVSQFVWDRASEGW